MGSWSGSFLRIPCTRGLGKIPSVSCWNLGQVATGSPASWLTLLERAWLSPEALLGQMMRNQHSSLLFLHFYQPLGNAYFHWLSLAEILLSSGDLIGSFLNKKERTFHFYSVAVLLWAL